MSSVPKTVAQYMADMGAKGGKATGSSKARDPAHYKRLVAIRKANAKKRKAAGK